jgi:hypothetical protein
MLELSFDLAGDTEPAKITEAIAAEVATGGLRRFDKQGEAFYDQISAAPQVGTRQRSGRGALLVLQNARRWLRPALHRTSRAAHGIRRHRQLPIRVH